MARTGHNWYDPMPALVEAVKTANKAEAQAEENLEIAALTVKEIEEKVASGELTADEVYKAELAGKQRKGVLKEYAPKDDDADNEQGTGEDAE